MVRNMVTVARTAVNNPSLFDDFMVSLRFTSEVCVSHLLRQSMQHSGKGVSKKMNRIIVSLYTHLLFPFGECVIDLIQELINFVTRDAQWRRDPEG